MALALAATLIAGCDSVVPSSDPVVVAKLREPPGMAAYCTGDPLPPVDECREQGHQALEERPRRDVQVIGLQIDFRAGAPGCRTVTWRFSYFDRSHDDVPTQVCP